MKPESNAPAYARSCHARLRLLFRRQVRLLVALAFAFALLPASASAAGPNAVQELPGCTANTFPGNDDSSTEVKLPFKINYFGAEYESAWLNNNGNLTFNEAQGAYTPFDFTVIGEPIIAPFLADVDTRVGALVTYGATTVDGHEAFCVNWVNVGYYSEHTDKTNSFQLLLIKEGPNPGDFVIRMNYDRIAWETGDASGGQNGFGGTSAAAGFASGDGDPSHAFVFAGSFTNGALLDGGPDALIAGSKDAGGQLGRYNFPIVNGPPTGATLTGHVFDPSSKALASAPVEICPTGGGPCIARFTNASGVYRAINLPAGSYNVTGYPPSGDEFASATVGPVSVSGTSTFTEDVTLGAPLGGPPPGTTVFPQIGESEGGVPTVYWNDELKLATDGCENGTGSYRIEVGGQVVRSGSMTEGPPGHYTASVAPLFPNDGGAHVHLEISCPEGPPNAVDFSIYIDPSGTVTDSATGTPIQGATVTLFRSDTPAGPFIQVPTGTATMSPANRENPDTTDETGHFGWDVIAGYYKVRANKEGCGASETGVLSIPPPVTDLKLALNCGGAGTPPSPPPAVIGPISPPPLFSPPVKLLARPTIGAVRQSATRWRLGTKLAQMSKAKRPAVGTIFSFTLNVGASVRFSFTQKVGGRKVGKRCVAQTKANAKRKACTRTVVAGTLSFTGHTGLNRVRFQGRISRSKKLKLGRYTLIIIAANSAGSSVPKSLSFTVVG